MQWLGCCLGGQAVGKVLRTWFGVPASIPQWHIWREPTCVPESSLLLLCTLSHSCDGLHAGQQKEGAHAIHRWTEPQLLILAWSS